MRPLLTQTLERCPVCACEATDLVLHHDDALFPGGRLSLMQCSSCESVFLNPRLSLAGVLAVEEVSDVYDYSDQEIAATVSKLEAIVEWLEQFVGSGGRRLLDIGCNRGFLLEAARRRGWDVTGIELSGLAADRARRDFGLVVYGSFDEVPQQRFDLQTAWHVLEHTHDPVAFVRTAGLYLADDGILAIQVPGFEYLEAFRERGRTSSLLCAVHNVYFTSDSLREVIKRAGLVPREVFSWKDSMVLTAICSST
jgi:SAM-dependent methyltransferase